MSGPSPDPRERDAFPDWEVLARYVAGESPDDERARVRGWLAHQPDDAKVLEALDRLASSVAFEAPRGLDVEGALRRLKDRHWVTPVLSVGEKRARQPRVPVRAWWQSAAFRVAAVLGVAALGAVMWSRMNAGTAPQVAADVQVYRAGIGKPDSVSLPDGSQVVLAPGSELGVPANYGDGRREVRLVGQGWFNVRHDDGEPFVVKSSGAEIRDVGTVFSVRGDVPDRVRVSVHEGAVLVRSDTQAADRGVLLHEGDEAVVTGGAVETVTRGTLSPQDADWVSGRLHFRDVTLAEFAATLRRWYGVEIRVTDPVLSSQKISTDVSGGAVDAVLREVALAVDAELERRGDTVIVRRR
jgi:ferric-dicitrate binding protein FerR (iron transport regulator)